MVEKVFPYSYDVALKNGLLPSRVFVLARIFKSCLLFLIFVVLLLLGASNFTIYCVLGVIIIIFVVSMFLKQYKYLISVAAYTIDLDGSLRYFFCNAQDDMRHLHYKNNVSNKYCAPHKHIEESFASKEYICELAESGEGLHIKKVISMKDIPKGFSIEYEHSINDIGHPVMEIRTLEIENKVENFEELKAHVASMIQNRN